MDKRLHTFMPTAMHVHVRRAFNMEPFPAMVVQVVHGHPFVTFMSIDALIAAVMQGRMQAA